MSRLVKSFVAVTALTVLSSPIAFGAGAPFTAVMIKQTDLPKQFIWASQQTLLAPPTTTWFPTSVALRHHGYQLSFWARFDELVPHARPQRERGALLELMDRYASSAGAQWGYAGRLSQRYPRAKLLALKTVGNESSAWNNTLSQPPFTELEILFRRAGYVVDLHCDGTIAGPSTCLHYAKLIDTRIKTKG